VAELAANRHLTKHQTTRDAEQQRRRGNESRKQLIQGSPVSGSPLALPEAKPMKITQKIGEREVEEADDGRAF
jgi:hypothetical protein